MIELKRDELTFSFPEMDCQVREMVDVEIGRRMPTWLAEDRAAALQRLCETNWAYREASAEWRQGALAKLTRATEEDFRRAAWTVVRPRMSRCRLRIAFMRTLRIPDDGTEYPLPPGFDQFPLRHVDDFALSVPDVWRKRGGVMMPMYQSEALWLNFGADYPFAVKIATGRVNAISGDVWRSGLGDDPQDYVVVPEQPWLDGYCVERGVIRQFVAMPLGDGYGVEEQISGRAEFGGLQIQAYPLKAKRYFEEQLRDAVPESLDGLLKEIVGDGPASERLLFSRAAPVCCLSEAAMSLAAGGRMRQEVYEDERGADAWEIETTSRCFVHLCDSLVWRQITGLQPPHPPFTAKEYNKHGLPWFDWYDDRRTSLAGGRGLRSIKSVLQLGREKKAKPLPENESVQPNLVIQYGEKRRPEQVREWVEEA